MDAFDRESIRHVDALIALARSGAAREVVAGRFAVALRAAHNSWRRDQDAAPEKPSAEKPSEGGQV